METKSPIPEFMDNKQTDYINLALLRVLDIDRRDGS